jgi:molybdenum cofactor guanylyltransferase
VASPDAPSSISLAGITALILAGGKSTRMGGGDKALVLLQGRPMIEWVIDRLRPQVDSVMVNTNSEDAGLVSLGYPTFADQIMGHRGPLAGLHAGMACAKTALLACVPCDAPLLPIDLVARLHAALTEANADIAVARTPSSLQPTFFLCRNTLVLRQSIEQYLADRRYALRYWMSRQHCIEVDFPDEMAFSNINTPQDLQQIEAILYS